MNGKTFNFSSYPVQLVSVFFKTEILGLKIISIGFMEAEERKRSKESGLDEKTTESFVVDHFSSCLKLSASFTDVFCRINIFCVMRKSYSRFIMCQFMSQMINYQFHTWYDPLYLYHFCLFCNAEGLDRLIVRHQWNLPNLIFWTEGCENYFWAFPCFLIRSIHKAISI